MGLFYFMLFGISIYSLYLMITNRNESKKINHDSDIITLDDPNIVKFLLDQEIIDYEIDISEKLIGSEILYDKSNEMCGVIYILGNFCLIRINENNINYFGYTDGPRSPEHKRDFYFRQRLNIKYCFLFKNKNTLIIVDDRDNTGNIIIEISKDYKQKYYYYLATPITDTVFIENNLCTTNNS